MGPGLWAAKAHLPYLIASTHYQITAVSNSSIPSAQASIDFHHLGPDVKAYGSPEDLANDPHVDLIIVTVRVEKHYALTKPALLAGKDVFVEWPLGASTAEAEELTKLAEEKGAKTIVGLQARASPLVVKIKDLVDSGKIGKVLSSVVVGSFSGLPSSVWLQGGEYYLDIKSGGNNLTIYFGHCMFFLFSLPFSFLPFLKLTSNLVIDSFTHVLGPFTSLSSILKTQYKTINIINSTGEVVTPNYPKNTPDHVFVQGTLSSGALASIAYRVIPDPDRSIDGVGIRWLITGDEGEIELTVPEGQWQLSSEGVKLRARLGKGKEAEAVDFQAKGEAGSIGGLGANTAREYEAFFKGETDKFPDFKDALQTHKLLDLILEGGKEVA